MSRPPIAHPVATSSVAMSSRSSTNAPTEPESPSASARVRLPPSARTPSIFSMKPYPFVTPTSSSSAPPITAPYAARPAAASGPLSNLCPVCSQQVAVRTDAEYDAHVRSCLGLDEATSSSVKVPIATMHGVVHVAPSSSSSSAAASSSSRRGSQSQPMIIDDSDDEDTAAAAAAPSSTRHVLTSRTSHPASSSSPPLPAYPASPTASSSSSAFAATSSGVHMSFGGCAGGSPTTLSRDTPAYNPYALPTPSSSPFSSAVHMPSDDPPLSPNTLRQIAQMQSYEDNGGGGGGEDTSMFDDEALVRQMQAEEEEAAAAARAARQEAADREWRELIRQEGSCAKCGRLAAANAQDELIQICEDPARKAAAGEPTCTHKLCHDCVRTYLQTVLRRMQNPQLASPSSPSLLTESDLVCPYPSCCTPLSQWQMRACLPKEDFEALLTATVRNAMKRGSVGGGGGGGSGEAGGRSGMDGGASTSGTNTCRYVCCPNPQCGNAFEGVPGTGVIPSASSSASGAANSSGSVSAGAELGLDGQPMSHASKLHRAAHRFRCNLCSTVFCSGCSASPYHDGFDCVGWQTYGNQAKCRFCDVGLTQENTFRPGVGDATGSSSSSGGALAHRAAAMVGGMLGSMAGLFGSPSKAAAAAAASSSSSSSSAAASTVPPPSVLPSALSAVCTSSECLAKRALSCDRFLPGCGHVCRGVRGEKNCLVCLVEDCPEHQRAQAGGQDLPSGEDFCNVCYVEGLAQAPTIQLTSCSHLYHYACISSRLARKWPSARITFGFLLCPLCKVEVRHPALTGVMQPLLQLKADIGAKAVARLQFEGLDHDPAFEKPEGRYYRRKEEYAMDRFAYYMCSKCHAPYFGGQRRCEEAAQAGEEKFDPAQLVCGGCTAGADVAKCAKHGKEYIEHKCKFCCNVATWYCWGSTHFCQSCHTRQEGGDYVTRKPLSELPKCPGPGKCPLGAKHPPNGQEFTLGCGVCRPRDY